MFLTCSSSFSLVLAGDALQWISMLLIRKCRTLHGIYVKAAKLQKHLTFHIEQHQPSLNINLCKTLPYLNNSRINWYFSHSHVVCRSSACCCLLGWYNCGVEVLLSRLRWLITIEWYLIIIKQIQLSYQVLSFF